MILNEQGRLLLPLADEQIHRPQDILDLFNNGTSQSFGFIKLGASNTVGNHIVPMLLSDFKARVLQNERHLKQSLVMGNSVPIKQKLKAFEIDLGLVEADISDDVFHCQKWLTDKMLIVSSVDHPLVNQKNMTINALEKEAWVLREADSGTRYFFIHHIANKFTHYHVNLELQTTEAIINSVSEGLGLSCLSQYSAQHALKDNRLIALNLAPQWQLKLQRDYWIVCHKKKYQSTSLK